MRVLVLACAILMLSPAAWADTSAPSSNAPLPPGVVEHQNSPTQTEAVRNPNRMRCVRDTTTGSRLARRVCRTNAEWEEIQTAARRQAAERGGGGAAGSCMGDGPDLCGGAGRMGVGRAP